MQTKLAFSSSSTGWTLGISLGFWGLGFRGLGFGGFGLRGLVFRMAFGHKFGDQVFRVQGLGAQGFRDRACKGPTA